jgi:hypothetical protein
VAKPPKSSGRSQSGYRFRPQNRRF